MAWHGSRHHDLFTTHVPMSNPRSAPSAILSAILSRHPAIGGDGRCSPRSFVSPSRPARPPAAPDEVARGCAGPRTTPTTLWVSTRFVPRGMTAGARPDPVAV